MDTSRPRYLHMFLVFVKIGLFTIGGGPAMLLPFLATGWGDLKDHW